MFPVSAPFLSLCLAASNDASCGLPRLGPLQNSLAHLERDFPWQAWIVSVAKMKLPLGSKNDFSLVGGWMQGYWAGAAQADLGAHRFYFGTFDRSVGSEWHEVSGRLWQGRYSFEF